MAYVAVNTQLIAAEPISIIIKTVYATSVA